MIYRRTSSRRRKPYIKPIQKPMPLKYPEQSEWGLEDQILLLLRCWVIKQCFGNIRWAAYFLGNSPAGLRYQIKQYKKLGKFNGEINSNKLFIEPDINVVNIMEKFMKLLEESY